MGRRETHVLVLMLAIALLLLSLAVYFLKTSTEGFKATGAREEVATGSKRGAEGANGILTPTSVEPHTIASGDQEERTATEPLTASSRSERRIKDIVGTSGCQMVVRSTSTQSIVLISIPRSTGARFILLDDERVISEGQLPFIARRMSLGLPELTAPLIAFSVPSADASGRHHLRVFRGSGEIFSGESVLDYGLAKDGSSYFVVEPLAGDSAHLRVRNFTQGSERHFDLDQVYAPDSEGQLPYHAGYSLDETEIQLIPSDQDLERNYRFFPVGNGKPRRVKVQLHSTSSQVLFASSDILYMATITDDQKYAEIIKYSSTPGARWKLSQEWRSSLYPLAYTGHLSLAEEGEILVVHGDPAPSLLSTSNGDMLFSAPMWNEIFKQELGEQAFMEILMGFRESGTFPDSGLVQRESLIQSSALIGILNPVGEPNPDGGRSMRLSKVLDSEDLGDTNQKLEIPSRGFPTPCRVADSSFVGVSATAAVIAYHMR